MTPEEIQDLRDWAAKKMGWRLLPPSGSMNQSFYEDKFETFKFWREDGFFKPVWTPDTDLNQCFLLVEKMREKRRFGDG